MTLGLAPTQGDLLRSTVDYCEVMALIEIPQCCSARFLTLGSCQG